MQNLLKSVMLLALLVSLTTVSWSQTSLEQNYTPILSTGQVPSIFLENRNQTLARDLKTVRSSGKLSKEQGTEFLVLNSEALRSTFQSGRILYGDEITQYLNEVAQRIERANPDYIGGLNLFATRVSVPNAAAWRNGVIFFNVGLLSRLDTESQLAFILAHEMAHIQNKHTLQKFSLAVKDREYIDPENRRKLRGKAFGRGTLDLEKVFKKYRYSRQFEMEADEQGLEWLKNTPYRAADATSALEILKNIDQDRYAAIPPIPSFNPDAILNLPQKKQSTTKIKLPDNGNVFYAFDDVEGDSTSVTQSEEKEEQEEEDSDTTAEKNNTDTSEEAISEKKKKRKKRAVDEGYLEGEISEEEFLDSTRTHPSVEDRIAQIQGIMPAADVGESFVSSPIDFIKIRTYARFEMVETHFEGMNYLRALYEALHLLQEYPDNEYLSYMVCRSAYWYTLMESQSSRDNFTPKPKNYAGEAYGEFADYFNNLSKSKRTKWCISLLEHYTNLYPKDNEIQFILAQAYDQFDHDDKAKVLYKQLLHEMGETHEAFIQDKLNNL
jgi:predicted Zn-dependent protease